MPPEREKMLAGELYDPLDAELAAARFRARDLSRRLNSPAAVEISDRRKILSQLFATGGDSAWVEPPFYCDYGVNISLGREAYLNFNCVILDVCRVTVGDYAKLGPGVHIYTATHPLDAALRRREEFGKPVTIGDDVWIGGGAIICPGVTIGDRTVIGAGSVVTRDLPSDVFAAGNPCRVIRNLNEGATAT